jgi:hypothetical protein
MGDEMLHNSTQDYPPIQRVRQALCVIDSCMANLAVSSIQHDDADGQRKRADHYQAIAEELNQLMYEVLGRLL